MVVCDKSGIKEDGVHTAPLFVAEITSDSTKKNDYGIKMYVYGEIGVKEYWIVDLQRNAVVKYVQERGFIPEMAMYPSISELAVDVYPGLTIDLAKVFGQS